MRYAILLLMFLLFIPACAAPVEASTSDTMAPPIAAQYDANGNNMIEKNEAIDAVIDYFNGTITKEQAIDIIILYFSGGPIQEQTTPPLSEVVADVIPAVVKIENTGASAQGSGVIYKISGQTGYIITNQHVVRNAASVTVTVGNSKEYHGTVVGVDTQRDLALVTICCNSGFTTADFGDSEQLSVGDDILAIGYPVDASIPKTEGYAQPKVIVNPGVVSATVTRGIVSAVRYDSGKDVELLQTDAPINPGNSGGPLLALDGTIVGIVTFLLQGTEGLNFAILETTVQERIPTLEAGTTVETTGPRTEFEFNLFGGAWPGHIHHEPDNLLIESLKTRTWAADAVVSARFHNPYAGSLHGFDYGFILRNDRTNPNVSFIVDSSGRWHMHLRTSSGPQQIATGPAPGLANGAGWTNYLQVGIVGDWAWFDLNGEPLRDSDGEAFFRLGIGQHSGAAEIVTGFFTGNEQHGAETTFEGFTAHEIVTYSLLSTSADVERLAATYNAQSDPSTVVKATAPIATHPK